MKTFFVLKNKNEIFGIFTDRPKAAKAWGLFNPKGLKVEEYKYVGPLSYEELIVNYSIQ